MRSFNSVTIRLLCTSAFLLGCGIFYHNIAGQWAEDASQALRSVETATSQLVLASQRAQRYNDLLESIAHSRVDRQEPFSVISEFSPQEIKQIGTLLDNLYRRDGYFFLEHFQLAWRKWPGQERLPPRVVMDLEGRKVLLFSAASSSPSAFVAAHQ